MILNVDSRGKYIKHVVYDCVLIIKFCQIYKKGIFLVTPSVNPFVTHLTNET